MSPPLAVVLNKARGFHLKAWKKHVMLVRGSMSNPEIYRIDMKGVLNGKGPEMMIEPGDIVYVHSRPWSFVEDLLDVALKAFIDGAVDGALDPERVGVSNN